MLALHNFFFYTPVMTIHIRSMRPKLRCWQISVGSMLVSMFCQNGGKNYEKFQDSVRYTSYVNFINI